jgi:DNA-binding response OmpR family regulator
MSDVLIVDDSLTVRMDLSESLEAAGVKSELAATALEARALFDRQHFSLIILDINLPDGDGIDLLREIRTTEINGKTPVMLLSTEGEVRDRIRGLATGADEYVGKPYETSYVVARARELLKRDTKKDKREDEDQETPALPLILLIDDSMTFREMLKGAMISAGYRVLAAETGEEGLRLAADARPAAVVVDGMLPGIDGATVIRRMRLDAALRRTPCLLLTASDEPDAEIRALDVGADAFLRKDQDISLVLAKLAAVLRSGGARTMEEEMKSLLAPKRILAVDDSPTYLYELGEMLRSEGYDVVAARSGEEALELLAVETVDCVLLDLMMPGLGGQETCRRIKGSPVTRDLPLIILTSVEDREVMIQSLSAGADDYVSKASDFPVLRARVLAQIRRRQLEDETRRIRDELILKDLVERRNKELEAFSYSVSHDLRSPLRAIKGFSRSLLEDHASGLSAEGLSDLKRVVAAAERMGELIEDLLKLSRLSRAELVKESFDLSEIARSVTEVLLRSEKDRDVTFVIEPGVRADGDPRLMKVVLENLLGNAFKFTKKTPGARIELGETTVDQKPVYFVRDNGAGFDMRAAARLFGAFQRLHSETDFPGTGIGLATVQRIIDRHGGKIWAESAPGKGATFFFTLSRRASVRN